jgi:hypothetical protein
VNTTSHLLDFILCVFILIDFFKPFQWEKAVSEKTEVVSEEAKDRQIKELEDLTKNLQVIVHDLTKGNQELKVKLNRLADIEEDYVSILYAAGNKGADSITQKIVLHRSITCKRNALKRLAKRMREEIRFKNDQIEVLHNQASWMEKRIQVLDENTEKANLADFRLSQLKELLSQAILGKMLPQEIIDKITYLMIKGQKLEDNIELIIGMAIDYNKLGYVGGSFGDNEIAKHTALRWLKAGKKIQAIKEYRKFTGVTLKQAKDVCDQLERDLLS